MEEGISRFAHVCVLPLETKADVKECRQKAPNFSPMSESLGVGLIQTLKAKW